MRRALLRSLLLTGAAGGLPPRRPDQVTPSNPAGTAPGTTSSVQRVRQLIISGPGSGAFLYSGPPGQGDLVESMTEAAADPFGNPTEAGFASYDLVFGGSAQLHGAILKLFSGITLEMQLSPAGQSVFNSQGALIYSVDVSRDAWFLYADTGSATQGALIASSASAAGTDTFGNTFLAGLSEYVTIAGTRWAVTLAESVAAFGGTLAGVAITNLTAGWSIPASVAGLESGGGASLELSSGLQTAGGSQAALLLQDSVVGATPNGLMVGNAGGYSFQIPTAGAKGFAQFLLSNGAVATAKLTAALPDGNTYRTERLIQEINGTLPQVISSTSQVNVQGLSVSVAAGKYRVRGRLSCTMGGSAGPMGRLVVTGPAISQMEMGYWSAQNNPGAATLFTATQTAIGTLTVLTSVNQGAGSGFTVIFDGTLTFSAAGTMTLAAAESLITSVPWQINANSYWEVSPE